MTKPKIVYWDLETLPDPREIYKRIPSIGAWPGRTFKADIQGILCFGYKIEGQKKARCINRWDFPDWELDHLNDKIITEAAYEILYDADEIVTHNGKRFDLKVLNTRLAYHGFPPLPKIHHVDTMTAAKSGLSLYSNSLDAVAKFYGCESKIEFKNKWDMWYRIAFKLNSKKDLNDMTAYCKQDVEVLEQIYKKLRPHHGHHSVNKNNWIDPEKLVCPTCGSDHLHSNGIRIAGNVKYKRMHCQECGTWSKLNIKETKISAL